MSVFEPLQKRIKLKRSWKKSTLVFLSNSS